MISDMDRVVSLVCNQFSILISIGPKIMILTWIEFSPLFISDVNVLF
jgi:hypothetical protein